MISFTAVLFAGGESRRMGTEKASLIFNGQPLWRRQLNLLQAVQPQKILISARQKPAWCPAEVETVLDASPSCGPLGGLAAALEKIETTHLLALAVDLPTMPVNHLKTLMNLATKHCGVLPKTGNFFEPLCSIYPQEAGSCAADFLRRGERSFQILLPVLIEKNWMRVHRISRSEENFYRNTNTREEFDRAQLQK